MRGRRKVLSATKPDSLKNLRAGNINMKKRLSIFLIGTAVSVVAVVGAFAGLAAAQSNDDDGDSQTFVERVAAILGVESG